MCVHVCGMMCTYAVLLLIGCLNQWPKAVNSHQQLPLHEKRATSNASLRFGFSNSTAFLLFCSFFFFFSILDTHGALLYDYSSTLNTSKINI